MTNYSKLVEMLEAIVSNGELGSAGFAKQALPLARQLVEENERLREAIVLWLSEWDKGFNPGPAVLRAALEEEA